MPGLSQFNRPSDLARWLYFAILIPLFVGYSYLRMLQRTSITACWLSSRSISVQPRSIWISGLRFSPRFIVVRRRGTYTQIDIAKRGKLYAELR